MRPYPVLSLLLSLIAFAAARAAEQRAFDLAGSGILLEEITPQTEIFFESMRLNRALNVWNVEVSIRNRGSAPIVGPVVLSVESFAGTSGALQADGTQTGRAFYDLSGWITNGVLEAGFRSRSRTLTLGVGTGAPVLTNKVYAGRLPSAGALALARTINDAGQPLPETDVEETAPDGKARRLTTDARFGFVTLGGSAGPHSWKFQKPGYLPSWRFSNLSSNGAAMVPYPRLTPRSTNHVTISPLSGGALLTDDRLIRVQFLAGTVAGNAAATLTALQGQALPAYLPAGWSPLQAFWLEAEAPFARPASAFITPWGPFSGAESIVLARWNESALRWEVAEILSGSGTNGIAVPVSAPGAYAVIVADTGSTAPAPAEAGQAVPAIAVTVTNYGDLRAGGRVVPSVNAASLVPERVTAQASVNITNISGALPSGLLLRCEVAETYQLLDGTRRITPRYDSFLVGYQRPGDGDNSTLTATFPMRPLLLFGADELLEARLTADVLAPETFTVSILETNGGQIAAGEIRVLAGTGDLLSPQGIYLRSVDPTNFYGIVTNEVVGAFELGIGQIAPGRRLTARFGPLSANDSFVLARVLTERGLFGMEPVERFSTDAAGTVTSSEPSVGERLPGITGAGQYLVVRVDRPQGLVLGTARSNSGHTMAGLAVRLEPWLTFSGTNGSYRLVAPTGSVDIAVSDPSTGDNGRSTGILMDVQSPFVTNISVAASGPRVIALQPAAGAVSVPPVNPIAVTFSRPLQPGTILNNGLQLLGANDEAVPATIALNLKNTIVTLLPLDPLAPGTAYTLRLSTNLLDLSGRRLEGSNSFGFTTARDTLTRGAGGQVISFEPTNGEAIMIGSQGIADPASPVIFLNETSGKSSTVLASADGSFSNIISADVNDFLSAILINANGTRTTIPVSRQLFADGRVGLFSAGGVIETTGPDGPIRVEIPPGAIPGKTIFKLEPAAVSNVLAQFRTAPSNGTIFAAAKLTSTGDKLNAPLHFSFTIDPARVALPPGTNFEDIPFVAATPQLVDGVTAYRYLAPLQIEATNTAPQPAALKTEAARLKDGVSPVTFTMGGAAFAGGFDFLLGLNLDPGTYAPPRLLQLFGRVISAQVDATHQTAILGTERPLAGAVVAVYSKEAIVNRRQLDPGELYTKSDDSGRYMFLVPRTPDGNFVATALHPKFPGLRASSPIIRLAPGQHNVLARDIIFDIPLQALADTNAPAVYVSHSPRRPVPTSNAVVVVSASDDSGVSGIVEDSGARAVFGGGAGLGDVSVNLLSFASGVARFEVSCTKVARVDLIFEATDNPGNKRRVGYSIHFGGTEPLDPNPVFAANPNDLIGPFVVATRPPFDPFGAGAPVHLSVSPGEPIVIRFNEPIDAGILSNVNDFVHLTPAAGTPTARLEENQRELVLNYPEMLPATIYNLTVQDVQDVSHNVLDQIPGNGVPNDAFTSLSFRTAGQASVGITAGQIEQGGGALIRGIYAYILDRKGALDGALTIWDLSDPTTPQQIVNSDAPVNLPAYPRDFVFIPHYTFKRNDSTAFETKDLLAIVGGAINGVGGSGGGTGLVTTVGDAGGQFLYVIDVNQPTSPAVVASGLISLDGTAAATRVAWSAPNLAIIENKSDYASIHIVELQRFIYGRNTTDPAEIARLPLQDLEGVDGNADGDFDDAGDVLPLPGQLTKAFPGNVDLFTLDENRGRTFQDQTLAATSRFINDIAAAAHGNLIGAVIGPGIDKLASPKDTNSVYMPGSYRTFLRDQDPGGSNTTVFFPNFNPKRLLVTTDIPWPDPITGQSTDRTLAIVAMVSLDNQSNELAVIDITVDPITGFPGTNVLNQIVFGTNAGRIQGIARADNGQIVVSTLDSLLLFEPSLLTNSISTNALPQALVAILPDAGSGVTAFGFSSAGMAFSSLRERTVFTQFSPSIRVVTTTRPVIDSGTEFPTTGSLLDEVPLFRTPLTLSIASNGGPATLTSADPSVHFYALVAAPGSAGAQIELLVESLDARGELLARDPALYPPASMDHVPAYQLTTDMTQPGYNLYLSRPIALVQEELTQSDYNNAINNPFDRVVLAAGNSLRVSFASSMSGNTILAPFATLVNQVNVPPPAGSPPGTPPTQINVVQPGSSVIQATGIRPGFLEPTNDSVIAIHTSVDMINHFACPGSVRFRFALTHEAFVTLQVAPGPGLLFSPIKNAIEPKTATVIPQFIDIPFPAGTNEVEISSLDVGDMGQHPYELIASHLPFSSGTTVTNTGIIEHYLVMNQTYAIGHTIIEGVDIFDGHLTHSRQDVMIPGRRLSLEFTRSYSSSGDSSAGPLGAGWTHNYACRVTEDCGRFVVIGGEGSGNAFTNNFDVATQARLDALYAPLLADRLADPAYANFTRRFLNPQLGYHSRLVAWVDPSGGIGELDFFTKSGIRYHFVIEPLLHGKTYTLRDIREPHGNQLVLSYHPGGDGNPTTLDSVTEVDARGAAKRSLLFEYMIDPVFVTPRITNIVGMAAGGGDLEGLQIKYQYDVFGNLTDVVRVGVVPGENDERHESYTYTAGDHIVGHNMLTYTDPNGNVTRFTYKSAVAPAAGSYYVTIGAVATVTPFSPDNEIITDVTHDGAGVVADATTTFGYDFVGKSREIKEPRFLDTPRVPATTYRLNDYGATLRIEAPMNQTTIMEWATDGAASPNVLDENGQNAHDVLMTKKIDGENRLHEYFYEDGRGNLNREVITFNGYPVTKQGAPVSSIVTKYDYNPLFNQREKLTDAEAHETKYTVDGFGDVRVITDAKGNQTQIDFDPVSGDLTEKRDPLGNATRYSNFDPYGNAQSVTDAKGQATSLTFDERSRILTSQGPFRHDMTWTYDGLDRKIFETKKSHAGSGADVTVELHYLANGELQRTVNGEGHITQHFYDPLNRRMQTVEKNVALVRGGPVDYTWNFHHDRGGNVISEEDPRHITKTHTYDDLNRRSDTILDGPTTSPPAGSKIFHGTYDRVGNLLTETDLHLNTTTHIYDGLYRIVKNILPFNNLTTETDYDRMGNKLSETDANAHTTTMAYDEIYRLVSHKDATPQHNETEFHYDAASNKILEHNHSSGLMVEYLDYDPLNRPKRVTKTLGNPGVPRSGPYETKFNYDDPNNTVTMTNPRGFDTVTEKDGMDRVFMVTVNAGAGGGAPALSTTYLYDRNGNQRVVRDAEGGNDDVTSEYDGLNRKFRSTYLRVQGDMRAVTEEFLYDEVGNVVSSTDKRGTEFTTTYDNLNRPLEKRVIGAVGGNLLLATHVYADSHLPTVTTTDANGNPSSTQYDELNRAQVITDALGQAMRYKYDGVNKISETDKKGQETVFAYDEINRPIRTEEYAGPATGPLMSKTSVLYEDLLNKKTETDRNGYNTISQMDSLGRLITRSRDDSVNPPPDPLSRLYGRSPLVLETREYDENNNVVSVEDGNGNLTTYAYDGADRKISMTEGANANAPVKSVTTYKYDNANNLTDENDGRSVPGSVDKHFEYDDRYRKTSFVNGLGETTRYLYDENNNLTSAAEPATPETTYTYDDLNKLLTVNETGRGGGITIYTYDNNRNKLTQKDAEGNETDFHYDVLNRLTDQIAVGAGLTWTFGYDRNNNTTSITDPRRQVATMDYDWLDRVTRRTYASHAEKDGANNPLQFQPLSLEYSYDGNGNVTQVVEEKAGLAQTEKTIMAYDALNRLLTRTRVDYDGASKVISYRYDIQGNRTRVTDPDRSETQYTYDERNRLHEVIADANTPDPKTTTYTWYEDSLLRHIHFANGADTDREPPGAYDAADRLLRTVNKVGGDTIISKYTYTYDHNGNRKTQREEQPALGVNEVTEYTYDDLDRLKMVNYGNSPPLVYTYQLNGNRLSEDGPDAVTGRHVHREFRYNSHGPKTYDGVNALSRIEDTSDPLNHFTIDYEYDENLNQIARVQGADRREFRYDIRDQIIATHDGASTTSYDYNFDRLRVKKLDNVSGETRYLYDQSSVLVEYGGVGASHLTHHKYDYGYSLLSLSTSGAGGSRTRDYYMTDGLRSTANLTGDAGALHQSYRYDVWGRVRQQAGVTDNARQYTGHYRDNETGLHYFGARYYDEEQGRFLSQDPDLGDENSPPSLHRYLYAYANPLRYIDLTGYETEVAMDEQVVSGSAKKASRPAYLKTQADLLIAKAKTEGDVNAMLMYEAEARQQNRSLGNAVWNNLMRDWGATAVAGASGGVAGEVAAGLELGWFGSGLLVGTTETTAQQGYRLATGMQTLSWGDAALNVGMSIGTFGIFSGVSKVVGEVSVSRIRQGVVSVEAEAAQAAAKAPSSSPTRPVVIEENPRSVQKATASSPVTETIDPLEAKTEVVRLAAERTQVIRAPDVGSRPKPFGSSVEAGEAGANELSGAAEIVSRLQKASGEAFDTIFKELEHYNVRGLTHDQATKTTVGNANAGGAAPELGEKPGGLSAGFTQGDPGRAFIDAVGNRFVGIDQRLLDAARTGGQWGKELAQTKLAKEIAHELAFQQGKAYQAAGRIPDTMPRQQTMMWFELRFQKMVKAFSGTAADIEKFFK